MNDHAIWQLAQRCLSKNVPCILLLVAESAGSSPGRAGFKMVIAETGERMGSIGGGIMEVNWVEQSLRLLRDRSANVEVRRVYHSRETLHEQSGLICSGSQTILSIPLTPPCNWVSEVVEACEKKECGLLRVSRQGASFEQDRLSEEDSSFSFSGESKWEYNENVGALDTVYIVGSGHVGLALSRIMATLDFRVVVIDDRAAVETFANNSYAHEKLVSAYDAIGDIVRGGNRSYVAVVTTGYQSDEKALRSVLLKNPRYIGLMGSDAKTKQIFDDLRNDGIADTQLSKIHSPIGLPIHSHTPEEIAVSIAAEIIRVRNERG